MAKEWVLVPWIVQNYNPARNRLFAKICPYEQMVGKIENGAAQIKPGYLIDDCMIVEWPDHRYEIQLPSPSFSGIARGPYATLEEIQLEVERYTGGVCRKRIGIAGIG